MRCRLYVYCPRLPSNSGHVLRQLRRVPLFRLASGQPCSPIDAANMALTCSLHLQFMKCFRLERILQFSIAWTALSWGMPCLIRAEWCRTLLPIYRCTHAHTHLHATLATKGILSSVGHVLLQQPLLPDTAVRLCPRVGTYIHAHCTSKAHASAHTTCPTTHLPIRCSHHSCSACTVNLFPAEQSGTALAIVGTLQQLTTVLHNPPLSRSLER